MAYRKPNSAGTQGSTRDVDDTGFAHADARRRSVSGDEGNADNDRRSLVAVSVAKPSSPPAPGPAAMPARVQAVPAIRFGNSPDTATDSVSSTMHVEVREPPHDQKRTAASIPLTRRGGFALQRPPRKLYPISRLDADFAWTR